MNPRRVVRSGRPVYSRGSVNLPRKFRLPAWNWRLVGLGVGVLVLTMGWAMAFSLQHTQIAGQRSVPLERLRTEVAEELGHHLGWGNLTTLDTEALGSRIKQREPLLNKVIVTRNWPHSIAIRVEERTPGLIWQTGELRYLVDSEGVVVGEADTSPTDLAVVLDRTNLPVKVGDRVVAERFITFIIDLRRLMPATKLSIKSLAVPETTTEVFVTTDKSYVVKFDTTRPATDSITALNRVLTELARVGKVPAEYIDLRIENRAYYK